MEKVLVEIYLPIADKYFDVFLPLKSRMYEVLQLLNKVVPELSDGLFISGEDTIICDRSDGSILNINMTIKELEIRNGTKLLLM